MVFDKENCPETKRTHRMIPSEHPDRIHVAFDDHRLVANAGIILTITLAIIWDWANWWTATLAWTKPPAEPMLATRCWRRRWLVECIDTADPLRAGGTEQVLGSTVKAPSMQGTLRATSGEDTFAIWIG